MRLIAETLSTAAHVTELLLERYGPDWLWQLRRLGPHTFQGWTTDGQVIHITVREDGSVAVKKMEAAY